MTLPVIVIMLASVALYLMASTLIFAIRHGQLKDIEQGRFKGVDRDRFAFKRYRKSVFLSETAWGVGFIAIGLIAVVCALQIGRTNAPVETITLEALVAMVGYAIVRCIRVYMVATGGVAPLAQRFNIYRRSDSSAAPLRESSYPTGKTQPLPKILIAAEHLDRDQHD